MNSDKHRPVSSSGNVMIYILIALALIGGLTMAISQQNNSASGQNLDKEKLTALTTKTVAYVGSAKSVVDQMMMSGTRINSLDFTRPSGASFDTAPYHNKIFHPSGGGLTYQTPDTITFHEVSTTPPAGWYFGYFNNVEWTPTTANDVLLVAYQIGRPLCEEINKKITGSTAIPVLPGNMSSRLLGTANGGSANSDLDVASCPACNGYPSLCIANSGSTSYAYYNIIVGQ